VHRAEALRGGRAAWLALAVTVCLCSAVCRAQEAPPPAAPAEEAVGPAAEPKDAEKPPVKDAEPPALDGLEQALKVAAEALEPAFTRGQKAAIALPQEPTVLEGYAATVLAFFLGEAGVETRIVHTPLLNTRPDKLPEAMCGRLIGRLEALQAHVGVLVLIGKGEADLACAASAYSLGDGYLLAHADGRSQLLPDVKELLDADTAELSQEDREWLDLFTHLFPAWEAPQEKREARLAFAEAGYVFEQGLWVAAARRLAPLVGSKADLCVVRTVFALRSAEQAQAASELIASALKRQPDSGPLYALKGWLLLRQGEAGDALMLLEQARLSDVAREGFYWIARHLLELERDDKEVAKTALLKGAELLPKEPYVQLVAARYHWRAAQFEESVKAYQRAVEAAPDDPDTWTAYGVALDALGRNDEAIEVLQRAVALSPDHARAPRHLAGLLKGRGESEEALAVLKTAADARPDEVALLVDYANAATEMGRLEVAQKAYALAISREPDSVDAKVGLARALARKRDYEGAQKILEEVLEEHPDCQPARLALGPLLAGQGKAEEGFELLKAAARAPGFEVVARLDMARLHNRLGQYEEGVRNAQIAVAAKGNAESYAVLARAFVGLKQWDKAEIAVKEALGTASCCEARMAAAELAAGREQHEDAVKAALEVVEAQPYNLEGLLLAGRLQLKVNRPKEGADLLGRAAELDRWDAALQWELAEVLRTGVKNTAAAVPHYERHVELNGAHAEEAKKLLAELRPPPPE